MYQTVGHDGISMYSEAMELPLFRRFIQGSALIQEKEYSPSDGDEVEDLYLLLSEIKVTALVLLQLKKPKKIDKTLAIKIKCISPF
jgi:diphthamide synthase (EF-2-diphthine--ammonia ligase)